MKENKTHAVDKKKLDKAIDHHNSLNPKQQFDADDKKKIFYTAKLTTKEGLIEFQDSIAPIKFSAAKAIIIQTYPLNFDAPPRSWLDIGLQERAAQEAEERKNNSFTDETPLMTENTPSSCCRLF